MSKPLVIAVDFDGTVVDHKFPEVGLDVPDAVSCLKRLVAAGHQIVLWTMRSEQYLEDAVRWFRDREIPLYGVQRNPTQDSWTTSPKCYAHLYIDDAAAGVPLRWLARCDRPSVDWEALWPILEARIASIQSGQG